MSLKNPLTTSKHGFFKNFFDSCKDFLSSFKCSCGSSRLETHQPVQSIIDLNKGRFHTSKNVYTPHANSKIDHKDSDSSHKTSCDDIKSMNLESLNKPLRDDPNKFENTINDDFSRQVLHVNSQASNDIINDFLIPSTKVRNHYGNDIANEMEKEKNDGFFSSLLIRAEAAAMGMFLGKQSLRTLARITIGKAGVDLVDKTHELVHCLFDDPKKANKFINHSLKIVSEFGVLIANGKISCDDMMSLREELEHICQQFLDFNDNLPIVNEKALDTAKGILNESVCRIEQLAIEMLPNQSERNKSVKTIREMAKLCRQPILIDKLYDKDSDAFHVAEEFNEKCEQINYLAELILSDRQHKLCSFINNSSQNRNLN